MPCYASSDKNGRHSACDVGKDGALYYTALQKHWLARQRWPVKIVTPERDSENENRWYWNKLAGNFNSDYMVDGIENFNVTIISNNTFEL